VTASPQKPDTPVVEPVEPFVVEPELELPAEVVSSKAVVESVIIVSIASEVLVEVLVEVLEVSEPDVVEVSPVALASVALVALTVPAVSSGQPPSTTIARRRPYGGARGLSRALRARVMVR